MEQGITRKRIKGYLGKSLFPAAEKIRRESPPKSMASTSTDSGDVSLFGIVPMGEARHEVDITLSSEGFVVEASCTCDGPTPCAHVGALLLSYIEQQTAQEKEPARIKSPPTASEKIYTAPFIPTSVSADTSPGARYSGDRDAARSWRNPEIYRNVTLRVDYEAVEMAGNHPLFSPVFRFSHPNPSGQTYRDLQLREIPGESGTFLFSKGKNRFWQVKGLTKETGRLLTKQKVSSFHISGLRHSLEKLDSIAMDFPYNSYSMESIEPPPVLDIREFPEGIMLRIRLKINDELEWFDGEKEVYTLPKGKNTLHIISVSKEWRERVYQQVRDTLAGTVIREDYRNSSYSFTAGISFQEYISLHGMELLKHGFELRKAGKKIREYRQRQFSFQVTRKEDWLEIQLGEESAEGFRRIHIDRDDEFILLDEKAIEKIRRLRLLGMDESGTIRAFPWNPALWTELGDSIQGKKPEEHEEVLRIRQAFESLKDFRGIEEQSEPAAFQGRLRPYQKAGLAWLVFLRDHGLSGCLADDMGLGKTIQTLALLQQTRERGLLGTALIVAPVSTLSNWEAEIEKFTPELSVYRHHGAQRDLSFLPGTAEKSGKDGKNRSADIILTSYATLRNDLEEFMKSSFTYLILDEAQAIKNAASLTFRTVKRIHARHRLTLTGTPLENNLMELWAQLDFLMPGLLGSRHHFYTHFFQDISTNDRQSSYGSEKRDLLRSMVYPFILRRTKKVAAPDLPDKEEILLYAKMEDDQREVYRGIADYFRKALIDKAKSEGIGKSTLTILEGLLRLRQAALLPSLVSDEYRGVSACKFELLKETVGEIVSEGNKVVIFSQFTGVLKEIRRSTETLPCGSLYLDGATKEREKLIKAFQEKDDEKIFLISLKAGGVGINLTAADYVIIFDPWWNPAVERQAMDRAHRIGRQEKVIVYRFVVRDSVEEKILKLQEQKRHLVDEIITEESSFIKSLEMKDLEFLLS
jgi:SNF2 family DNA or RNA helicase